MGGSKGRNPHKLDHKPSAGREKKPAQSRHSLSPAHIAQTLLFSRPGRQKYDIFPDIIQWRVA